LAIKKIQLLVTSDIHGYIMPTSYRGVEEAIGLAKAASLIEQLREERPSILIDNGDLIQGSPLAYYNRRFHSDQPNPIIAAANILQYDLAVFGNHEFNYGLHVLDKVVEQSNFPWLSANIYKEDGTLWKQPYVVLQAEGISIGIIGVTTHFVELWETPQHIEGLHFTDAFESAKKWLAHMREHHVIDVAVLCYHGGFAHDLDSGELIEADTGENQGYLMCKDLDVDIVITGHQHRVLCSKAFGKSIIQPGSKGICVAAVTIDAEIVEGRTMSIHHEPALFTVDEMTPVHKLVAHTAAHTHALTEQWLDEPVGHIKGNMLFDDAFAVRTGKHPYIDFIQHVQMDVTGAPISCTALFHDGPGGFREHVTMRDIVTNYIYPNTLKVLQITGHHIVAALEQCASYFTLVDDKLAVDAVFTHPKAQPYNYDMWEGIEYTMDIRRPVGNRITEVRFRGKPLDLYESYNVVMNNYRATGAGNFPYFADCPVIQDIQIDMTELIANYFEKHPVVQASCVQNWKIIY